MKPSDKDGISRVEKNNEKRRTEVIVAAADRLGRAITKSGNRSKCDTDTTIAYQDAPSNSKHCNPSWPLMGPETPMMERRSLAKSESESMSWLPIRIH